MTLGYDLISTIPPVSLPPCVTDPLIALSGKIRENVSSYFSEVLGDCRRNCEFLVRPGEAVHVQLGQRDGIPTFQVVATRPQVVVARPV
jgi:hypothetical protein